MALKAMQDEERTLKTWSDVKDFARRKDMSVRLLRCTPQLRVAGDEFIETEHGERVTVSRRGWYKLCSVLQCDYWTLQRISSPGLATQVLNDALEQHPEKISSRRIVVDGWTVVGVVGRRYQPYGHSRLVGVIDQMLERRQHNGWKSVRDGWYEIHKRKKPIARAVGTELRIVLPAQPHTHPVPVRGSGGKAPDVSWVGIEARNGLAGECAVSVRTTVFRLICANGLVRAAADNRQRVIHTGRKSGLEERVRVLFGTAGNGLNSSLDWLESLGKHQFDPWHLAGDSTGLTLLKRILLDLKNGPRWIRRLANGKEHKRVEALGDMAYKLAGKLSGAVWRSGYRNNATLWDFVNIFTEAAQQSDSLQEQLRIEEAAGRLADRLVHLEAEAP